MTAVWSDPPYVVINEPEDGGDWHAMDNREGMTWLATFATEELATEYAQWKTEQTGKEVMP